MKITLRKANAIQASINEAIKNLDFNTSLSINEFQKPSEEIKKASDKFTVNVNNRSEFLDALFEIRSSVSEANNAAGINSRLATVARLEKDISFFTPLAKAQEVMDEAVLRGKLGKIKSRTTEDPYARYENEVHTSHLTSAQIETFSNKLSGLKKEKQKIQDELLELNVRTDITLTETTVKVLTKLNLL